MLRSLLLLPGLLMIALAAVLILRPDPLPVAVREADALWQAERIGEARRVFRALDRADAPAIVDLRLAQIALLRGECPQAQLHAAQALGQPLRRDDAAIAHLVAGQCAALHGDAGHAEAEWRSVDRRSPFAPLADVLRAERALVEGRTTDAIGFLEAARAKPLPEPWSALVRVRIAQALSEPGTAVLSLQAIAAPLPPPSADTRPFFPISTAEIEQWRGQLIGIAEQPDDDRALLMGQHLLDAKLYRLAIVQFERVPFDGPNGVLAQAQAAFARWQLGQTAAAADQLRELAAAAPDEPVVATLFAVVATQSGALDAADAALNAAEKAHPLDPAIALVRSDLLAARRDYPAAVAERRRARDLAQPEVKARYAVAFAQQHLDLTYNVCSNGISAARDATTIAPGDAATWQVLAATLYHCRQYSGAAEAALQGIGLASDNAALQFYAGAALWNSGDRDAARRHLLRAADLDPAGAWRERAEGAVGW